MYNFNAYFVYIFIAASFFICNKLADLTIRKYDGSFWVKRRVVVPVGMLICIGYLFLLAWVAPNKYVIMLFSPALFYYVGLVAHATFAKVRKYNKLAEEHNPYGKKK